MNNIRRENNLNTVKSSLRGDLGGLVFLLLFFCTLPLSSKNLSFNGQLSGWGNYNYDNELPLWFGGRYIPELQWKDSLKNNKLFDLEASANIYGSFGFNPFDTIHAEGNIKPYRVWVRYSSNQYEIRLGLQKIDFGSANMLRPLMWFDRIDPRDPLQLTDGVWGLLGRYYWMNNANAWLWVLYGNKDPKTWETGETSQKIPEFGGRYQHPIPKGEAALSYHFREVDMPSMGFSDHIAENRIGLDAKWDITIGLWFEAAWFHKNKNVGEYTNQEMLTIGADYTFGIGNGLNVILENLLFSYDEKPFASSNIYSFTALSLSYPIGMSDNISAIVYYDWKNKNFYNTLNWKHDFKYFSTYVMPFWNPVNYAMPQVNTEGQNLFAGKGIQIMLVYNH